MHLFWFAAKALLYSLLFANSTFCQLPKPGLGESITGGQVSDESVKTQSLQTATAGGVSDDFYWWAEVDIGTGQTVNLTVDTGSSDLWVYGLGVNYTGILPSNALKHTYYTCLVGSTSNCTKPGTFSISYGGSSFGAKGYYVYDKVTIAGETVESMAVEVATDVGTMAAWTPDGILGLSWTQNNAAVPAQATFIERLLPSLPEPIFTVDFEYTGAGSGKANLKFGSIDHTKTTAGLVTVPVSKPRRGGSYIWSVDDVGFSIGDIGSPAFSLDGHTPFEQPMMFDTGGGPIMMVDPRLAQAYYGNVRGYDKSTNRFPCNAKLPGLNMKIGNGQVGYIGQQMFFNNPDSKGMCSGPLAGSDNAGQGGGVGSLFFMSHYVVFNMSSAPSIAFAPWNGTAASPYAMFSVPGSTQ